MVNSARVFGAVAFLCASILILGGVAAAPAPAPVPNTLVRLQQGWNEANEQTFYHTPQGTVLMPAPWLAALESPDGTPFMSPERMRTLGFIADAKSPANPYGWPIGFAINSGAAPPKETVAGTAGLTCAACHTGELEYGGKTLRVDGGQAHIDLDAFKRDLTAAITAIGANPASRAAFEKRAIQLGFPADRIPDEFDAYYKSVVASAPDRGQTAAEGTTAGPGRNDALSVIAKVLFNYALKVPTNTNKASAPVDYPYLWNIWNLNWVQYNAAVRQPMGRNIGEAIGVGAVMHLTDAGGALNPQPERWRTSIPVRNLNKLETLLESLQPPQWPEAVMGTVDRTQAARGALLFAANCAMCHGIRAIAGSTSHEWSVRVLPLTVIGTDPAQADNFRKNTYDATKLGLSDHADAATGLHVVTDAVRQQAYRDENIPPADWPALDGFGRPSDVTAPCGYKARPLVGVWATAPFLHNGSVPTVFALLSERRPAEFQVGSLTYDPVHLGLAETPVANSFVFDTSLTGNSNAGHWFTDDASRPGRIGRRLTDAEKYDLIAFLKSATYADYPHTTVDKEDPEPCVGGASGGYSPQRP